MDIDNTIKKAKMTITPKRNHDRFTDILHLLLLAHTQNPELRFCQLVSNVACQWADWHGFDDKLNDIFHCPDDQFINGLENLLDDFKQLDNYEK
jgi:uncharacterized protein YihD (DUF1040 family)